MGARLRRMRCLLVLPLFAAAPSAARAQASSPDSARAVSLRTGTLIVLVGDTATAPLDEAEVLVPTVGVVARVNATGEVRILEVRAGRHVVSARHIGYRPESAIVVVGPGETHTVAFYLEPSTQLLGTFVVRGRVSVADKMMDFDRRRSTGMGTYITRQQIEERNPSELRDMLRIVQGIAFVSVGNGNTQLRFARSNPLSDLDCPPEYWVDGLRAVGVTIDDFRPVDVEALEIYRGASQMPAQFLSQTSGCGVIVVWSRAASRTKR